MPRVVAHSGSYLYRTSSLKIWSGIVSGSSMLVDILFVTLEKCYKTFTSIIYECKSFITLGSSINFENLFFFVANDGDR